MIAGKAALATLLAATTYPKAEGEIEWATDVDQLYVGADPAVGGSARPIPTGQAKVALTEQAASIGTTVLQTPAVNGLYRLSYYLEIIATDPTGTITLTLGWTDDNGAQTLDVVNALSLAATGYAQGQVVEFAKTTGNITYAVTLAGLTGSPQFNLYVLLERLF